MAEHRRDGEKPIDVITRLVAEASRNAEGARDSDLAIRDSEKAVGETEQLRLPHLKDGSFDIPRPVKEYVDGLHDTISGVWEVLADMGVMPVAEVSETLGQAIRRAFETKAHPQLFVEGEGPTEVGDPSEILPIDGALALLGNWARRVAHDTAYRSAPESRTGQDGTVWTAIVHSDRIELFANYSAFAIECASEEMGKLEVRSGAIVRRLDQCKANLAGNVASMAKLEGHADELSHRNLARDKRNAEKHEALIKELSAELAPYTKRITQLRKIVKGKTTRIYPFDLDLSQLVLGVRNGS